MQTLKTSFIHRSPWTFVALALALGLTVFQFHQAESKDSKPVNVSSTPPSLKLNDPLPSNLFVELAKAINPAVVNISTEIRPRRSMSPYGRDPFWEFFEEFMGPGGQRGAPNARPAQSIGTGFIIDPDGFIVTNNHVVEAADVIKVQLVGEPDKFHDAEVVGSDKRTDVALIRVKVSKKLPTVSLGSSADVEVGEWVAAFGNPYGHTFSMSKGIISAKSRSIRDLNAVPFLQTDASINPGNSGGPLVNTKGLVIGVNSAIDARAQGIGFAIPIDHVKNILPQLKESGRVRYGYLGVELSDISGEAMRVLKLPSTEGALIMGVMEGSPAEKGGLQPYDVVTEFNGRAVKNSNDLGDAVKDTQIGKSAKVLAIRNGKKTELSLTVAEPPNMKNARFRHGEAPKRPGAQATQLGFEVSDLTSEMKRELQLPPGSPTGPVISEVEPGSPAARSGLRPGDIILDVNKNKVKSAKDVSRSLVSGVNVFRVYHAGRVSLVFLEAN